MKRHSPLQQIIIFLCLLFFVIPPLFNTGNNFNLLTFQKWTFPYNQLFLGVCFFLNYLIFFYSPEKDTFKALTKTGLFVYGSFTFLFTLSLLFFTALIFKYLSLVIPSGSNNIPILKPQGFLQILFCIINFTCSAVYEEVLYRACLPEVLLNFADKLNYRKISGIFIEITVTLLFAFAHLYAGWLSVLNAVIAHVILRLMYKKTGNLYTNMIAHGFYNILILFVF